MHNWRFLLLAFVAVFKPIASFTERGEVDGRQQRCDYRAASLLRESAVRFHGISSFTKPALGDHRLNQREDVIDVRNNEVRENPISTPPQKQLVDTVERGDRTPTRIGRFSRDEYRLNRNAAILRRESRGAQHRIDNRDERSENSRQRSIYQTRQTTFDSRLRRAIDDDRRISSRHSMFSMESRRESESNRDNTEAQRAREIRLTLGAYERVRDDVTRSDRNARRIARERTPKKDMRRSESQLQLERNADYEMGRSRNKEFRSSLARSARLNRAADDEESQLARGETRHSFDREERHTQSRRILENFSRNIQNRASGDHRTFRESSVRTARTRDLQTDQPLENRREFISRDVRFNSDKVVEAQRKNRNTQRDTRLVKAKPFQENRLSQRDSRNTERDRSVETRSSVRDTRGIERNLLSVDRAIENRRALYSLERGNERDVRNIEKDSRRKRSTDNCYFNRQSCSLNSERTAERRETGQGSERAIGFFPERDPQTERNSRDVQRKSRIPVLQRDAEIQRATREIRRESPVGRDSIKGRNVRTDIRSIENRRSTTETRSVTIENDSRREARNNERRTRSLNRDVDSRDNRRNAHTLSQKRISEIRDSRAQRDSRAIGREMAVENRRSIQNINRQSRTMEVERNIENRRTNTREVERNSIRSLRPADSQGEIRITTEASRTFLLKRSAEDRRERFAERRRELRDIEKDSQAVLDTESRGVESKIKNMRARSSLSMDRNSIQAADRVTRDIHVDSRRSRSVQRESRSERTSMETERRETRQRSNMQFTRGHEFLSATGYPENATSAMNWQYLVYMLQGLYLCGILTQLVNEKKADMKNRTQSWWSAPQQLLKVD